MQLKDLVIGRWYHIPEHLQDEGVTCYKYCGNALDSGYDYHYFDYYNPDNPKQFDEYGLVIEEDLELEGFIEIEGYTWQ